MTVTSRPTTALHTATSATDWTVSRVGNITAADVNVVNERLFTAVSVYANWEVAASRGYADGEAHRILSGLTALMCGRRHRLVVAGDWNILLGYGEYGNAYWKTRYDTVFDRAEALGCGSQAPSIRTADKRILGLPSYPITVCAYQRSITPSRIRRLRHASSTSCSSRHHSLTR